MRPRGVTVLPAAARRKDSGEILGVHIFGLHAADLIHEASNAVATGQSVADIKFNVHAHPTLSEVPRLPSGPVTPLYSLQLDRQT